MKKVLLIALMASLMMTAGCMGRTGDLGNKNIRPNATNYDTDHSDSDHLGMNSTQTGRTGLHNNAKMEISEAVSKRLADLPEIESAYVMLTDRNAYVAVNQQQNASGKTSTAPELTNALKDKIANHVKAISPSTANVYVSANPDFIGRMRGYAEDVRNGHPIAGLVTEFNALVQRIFPTEAGAGAR